MFLDIGLHFVVGLEFCHIGRKGLVDNISCNPEGRPRYTKVSEVIKIEYDHEK